MIDLPGTELDPASKELLEHPLVGGVILFTRNYESPSQVTELVSAIHALRETELLVAVDHEGGRVQRFREGFTRLPPVADLGRLYQRNAKQARRLAQFTGWLNAAELRACGIDLNFAPVLDLDFGVSSVIGDRAFARDPQVVADLAHAYMHGMHDAGMSAVGKHFPGHGAIAADSHDVIAVDDRPYADIREDDLLAFERMMHYGLPAIMAAHVIYPRCDAQPAGFSSFWLHQVLRDELEFQGAVFSDDLSMKGAHGIGDIMTRTVAALEAGCDMALICNDRPAAEQVLDELKWKINPVSNARLLRLQGHGHVAENLAALHGQDNWREAVHAVNSYALTEELDLDI
jgi:beta-N-acetylhexosaminidase